MLGSVTALLTQLGIPSILNYLTIFFKNFKGKNVYKISSVVPALFQMMPRDVWTQFESTDWMIALQKRIKADKMKVSLEEKTGTVVDIFPSNSEKCVENLKLKRTERCYMGLEGKKTSGKIENDYIEDGHLQKILEKTSGNLLASSIWEHV